MENIKFPAMGIPTSRIVWELFFFLDSIIGKFIGNFMYSTHFWQVVQTGNSGTFCSDSLAALISNLSVGTFSMVLFGSDERVYMASWAVGAIEWQMKVQDTMWMHQLASANPIMLTFSISVILSEAVGINILHDCLHKFSEKWSRDSGNHQVSESPTSL